jgi:hypothetical protein
VPLPTAKRSAARPETVLNAFASVSVRKWNCSVVNAPFVTAAARMTWSLKSFVRAFRPTAVPVV